MLTPLGFLYNRANSLPPNAETCPLVPEISNGMSAYYFHDNNGIALEASVWINIVTGREPQFANPNVFQDSNPVPALAEQMERDQLLPSG